MVKPPAYKTVLISGYLLCNTTIMFRKSPVLRKEDHLHSQVPLKCRLHRAETSSCCCKAVLLAIANSAAAASGANATLQKKKNRYSGEIAAFNTSKGAVNIGLEKVSKLSCPTCCSEPRGQRGCWLHWNQFLERADRIARQTNSSGCGAGGGSAGMVKGAGKVQYY